jgi:uncharacterized phiE125 gp8 family phage protein
MGLTLVAPAGTPPVSLDDAKAWCRIDGTASDTAAQLALDAAVAWIGEYLGRALGQQTWRLDRDAFTDEIELPMGPVTDISTFTCIDPDGVEQTVSADIYTLDLVSTPQRLVRNPGSTWPQTLNRINVVAVTFVTGAPPPPAIRLAVLSLTAQWFDNRTVGDVPDGVLAQLAPFRQIRI